MNTRDYEAIGIAMIHTGFDATDAERVAECVWKLRGCTSKRNSAGLSAYFAACRERQNIKNGWKTKYNLEG